VPADPPTLRRSLFELLLGGDDVAARAADEVRRLGRGHELTRLAWAWRVVPRLRERTATGLSLGERDDAGVEQLAIAAAAQSTLFWSRACAAIVALEDAGLAVGAFKGIGSIAALYGTPSARMVSDVDLVIDAGDVDLAVRALHDVGFDLSEPIDAAGVHAWMQTLHTPMVHLRDVFVSMRDGDGFEVDLHLRFGHAPPPHMTGPSLLGRRRAATIGRDTIPVLAPADMMLLNVYNSLKDLMALRTTVRDLCDLAAWWDRGREQWSLDEVVHAARAARLETPMLTSWLLLTRADPTSPARECIERLDEVTSQEARRDARRILALVDHLLDDGRMSQGLLSTLSPQRARRYFAERRRRAAGAPSDTGPTVTDTMAGLRRIAAEAADARRLSAYRALGRAQRGFR
jgi:hypothetical protein